MSWLELDPGFIRARQPLLLAGLLLILAAAAQAQGVAINTNGAAADASAMLDISSTQRGFLPPRMTAAQRAAIVSPATGLLVYQSDGIVGLYYNAGTPAVPNWVLAGPGQGAGAGQWTVSGSNLYYTAGKIAVGTTPGTYGITVLDASNGLRVVTSNAGGSLASFGGVGVFDVDAPFVAGGRLRITEAGQVGIGQVTPAAPLSFANAAGKKISLWHSGPNTDYGFSAVTNQLQVHGGGSGASVALGYDNAGTFVEKLAVKPTGAIAVGGSEGAAGQVLKSNGAGQAAAWATPSTILQASSTGDAILTSGQEADIPGLSLTFTVPSQGGQALVQFSVNARLVVCLVCTGARMAVHLSLDGGGAIGGAGGAVPDQWEAETVSGSQVLTGLAPGLHTVSLRAMNTGGQDITAGVASVGGAALHSLLIVQVIPN